MREEKKKLAEFHRQRLQEEYQLRAATVKGAQPIRFRPGEGETGREGSGEGGGEGRGNGSPICTLHACPPHFVSDERLRYPLSTYETRRRHRQLLLAARLSAEPGSPGANPLANSFYSITNIRPTSPEKERAAD